MTEREESSNTPSPVKSSRFNNSRGINFKNVPEVDNETERMLNGTRHHQLRQFHRALDEQHARHLEAEEQILAIETTAGRYPMITQVRRGNHIEYRSKLTLRIVWRVRL